MKWVRTIWEELIGLFVDDGRFAALIVGWVVLCALVLRRTGLPNGGSAALLFAGFAAILIESAVRRARAERRP